MPPDFSLLQRDESSEESKEDPPQPSQPRRSSNQEEDDEDQQHNHQNDENTKSDINAFSSESESYSIIHNTGASSNAGRNSSESNSPLRNSQEKGPTQGSGTENVTAKRPRELNIHTIALGEQFDVLDPSQRWCEAEAVKIDRENQRVFVSYLYWDRKFDEWVTDIANRMAPLNTHTYYEGGTLKIGQRIEVLDEHNKWLESFVVDESESQVKIHYKSYHAKFDEWIDRSCKQRIRAYGRMKFNFPRSKNAVLWSARSHVQPLPASSSNVQRGSSYSLTTGEVLPSDEHDKENNAPNNNRVRYITDDSRTRKIADNSIQFTQYKKALEEQRLILVPVSGDGNCLFRSVAHQIYGNENLHNVVRQKCMDYMESEIDFFSQFIVGGREAFHLYIQAKRMNACWGDDPEIEAICEMYNRPAEIWAYDTRTGAKKLRTFHESGAPSSTTLATSSSSANASSATNTASLFPPMRLSYYGGGHYDSIVDVRHEEHVVRRKPGDVEDLSIARSRNRWLMNHNRMSVDEVRRMTDVEATDQAALDLALQESRRLQMNNESGDLESALVLSMQSPAVDGGIARGEEGDPAMSNVQSTILQTVQEESEREYLEKALISSLASAEDTAAVSAEDAMLQEALLNSQQESAAVHGAEKDVEIALKLSQLSPEEALELALQQSMQHAASSTPLKSSSSVPVLPSPAMASAAAPGYTTPPRTNGSSQTNHNEMSEEEMLQLALAESLKPAPTQPAAAFNLADFGDEYDEDLMLAIQASLQH